MQLLHFPPSGLGLGCVLRLAMHLMAVCVNEGPVPAWGSAQRR